MKLADLQLRHYHYNFIRLESSAESMDSDNEQKGLIYPELDASKVRTSITVGEPEMPKDSVEQFFIVTLGVEYSQPNFPYSFSLEVEGIFVWKETVDSNRNTSEEDDRKHLYVVNGVSILYSAIRDQLLSLTARHRHGPMLLPSADFRSITPSGHKE